MCNRKWWWVIWLWGLGVARANAYKIYEVMYDEELKKNGPEGVPPRWTHIRFIEELVSDLMFPEETAKHLTLLKEVDDSIFASSGGQLGCFLFMVLTLQRCRVISPTNQEEMKF
jgi:hypothetical protein